MANALAIAGIPVAGAASLAIMALGYYGRLQGATSQLAGVDAVRLQKEKALSQVEEKIAALQVETESKNTKKRSKKTADDDVEASLAPLYKQKEQIEKEIMGVEAGRKVVIRRGYRLRKMMIFLLIGISLAVSAGLFTTLSHYWAGFHWFSVICLLSAFLVTIISVVFAALELNEGVYSEEMDHRRVLLQTQPVWDGPLHAIELRLGQTQPPNTGRP